jgi:hypothetical protein
LSASVSGATLPAQGPDASGGAGHCEHIWRGNTIDILLLGPFQVWADDHSVSLTSSRQRALLGTLALSAGRLVSVDALARCVWGEELLQRIRGSLQTNVIAVTAPPRRRRLGD